MKQLIQQEVRRKGMSENIKLGEGGIREVEFIAQAFQLIHGGRDLSLQQRPLLKVLATLEGRATPAAGVVEELRGGYEIPALRRACHQALADRQTQMLPSDEYDRIRVAFIMGFASWAAFHERLSHWRARIDWHFRQVIADPDEDESGEAACGSVGAEWIPLWEEALDESRPVGNWPTPASSMPRRPEASQRSAPRSPGTSDAASRPGTPGCLRSRACWR